MKGEMGSIMKMKFWELVKYPKERIQIRIKWVFDINSDSNENFDRFRARLVAKGFSQQEGIDYFEAFAPVTKYISVLLLISLSVYYN